MSASLTFPEVLCKNTKKSCFVFLNNEVGVNISRSVTNKRRKLAISVVSTIPGPKEPISSYTGKRDLVILLL